MHYRVNREDAAVALRCDQQCLCFFYCDKMAAGKKVKQKTPQVRGMHEKSTSQRHTDICLSDKRSQQWKNIKHAQNVHLLRHGFKAMLKDWIHSYVLTKLLKRWTVDVVRLHTTHDTQNRLHCSALSF